MVYRGETKPKFKTWLLILLTKSEEKYIETAPGTDMIMLMVNSVAKQQQCLSWFNVIWPTVFHAVIAV